MAYVAVAAGVAFVPGFVDEHLAQLASGSFAYHVVEDEVVAAAEAVAVDEQLEQVLDVGYEIVVQEQLQH